MCVKTSLIDRALNRPFAENSADRQRADLWAARAALAWRAGRPDEASADLAKVPEGVVPFVQALRALVAHDLKDVQGTAAALEGLAGPPGNGPRSQGPGFDAAREAERAFVAEALRLKVGTGPEEGPN